MSNTDAERHREWAREIIMLITWALDVKKSRPHIAPPYVELVTAKLTELFAELDAAPTPDLEEAVANAIKEIWLNEFLTSDETEENWRDRMSPHILKEVQLLFAKLTTDNAALVGRVEEFEAYAEWVDKVARTVNLEHFKEAPDG